ncbi:MAG: 4-phosphoerythronate dehydrogenase [bacterium]
MKIVADENMVGVAEWFGDYGEITFSPGREITPEHICDADVLLVRSVTKVNRALLENSALKFVGSATIGIDHVDVRYLDATGICFANAPGCNAEAVVQYVLSAFAVERPDWRARTVGIVGCGNVGGRLYRRLTKLGVECLVCDPYLAAAQQNDLVDLPQLLAESDIVTLHTPLTSSGQHPTQRLISEKELALMKPGALLVNAARGGIVHEADLRAVVSKKPLDVVLDVWEGEPSLSPETLALTRLATPHIAGYSLQGKINGTRMVLDAFRAWLGEPQNTPRQLSLVGDPKTLDVESVNDAILCAYDIRDDDRALRNAVAVARRTEEIARYFDDLRKTYRHRLEFSSYQFVPASGMSDAESAALKDLNYLS